MLLFNLLVSILQSNLFQIIYRLYGLLRKFLKIHKAPPSTLYNKCCFHVLLEL